MWKKTLRAVNSHEFAKLIHALQNTHDELSFSVDFEVNEDGAVLESSTLDWRGVMIMGAFDGNCLIFGCWGGGYWTAYDATYTLGVDELEEIIVGEFKEYGTKEVCVEEATWVEA